MKASAPFSFGNLLLLLLAALVLTTVGKLDFIWVEAALLVLTAAGAAMFRDRLHWTARPPAFCAGLRRLSRKGWAACLLPALTSVVLRVALLPWIPIPHPAVPDEYSHLFLAKTFLLGRLANPAHPLWEHFETLHILSQPTFSSMYMAGQACFLALGKLLFGDFFWGVVLSTALFCAALTWFLRAYVPPGWALIGGMLAAVRIGAASYWNNSYWGGSAGALGGALVLGAYPRLVKRWSAGPAFAFGIGLILLAGTRPYEGAILGLALGAALVWNLYRAPSIAWRRVLACVAVVAVVLAIGGWGMTRQFQAVTGNPLLLPYQVNLRTYGWPMTLPWVKTPELQYRHAEFALYRNFEIGEHKLITVPAQIPAGIVIKFSFWWRYFAGVFLSGTFFFAHRIVRTRRTMVPLIAGGVVVLSVLVEQSGYPHYLAPAAPAVVLFFVQGVRYLTRWRVAGIGPAMVRVLIPVYVVLIGARAVAFAPDTKPADAPNFLSWCCPDARQKDREPLIQKLQAIPGEHLVLVAYDFKTYDTFEWVYNDPDIDRQRIVFARDMGPGKNEELLRYYPARHVWRVVVQHDHVAELESVRPLLSH